MAPENEDRSGVAADGESTGQTVAERRARELLRTASHDLRSPLTTIRLLVEAMERRRHVRGATAEDWTKALSRIGRVANHALALIDDVLSAERIFPDHAGVRSVDSEVDVEDVLTEAIVLQQEALDRAQCAVSVTRKSGLERAQGAWNRGCLLRIFSNLLQNASKYAPDSSVRVQLARAGDRLKIVFTDRGPGLPKEGGEPAGKYLDDGIAPTGTHGLGIWIVRRGVTELNGTMKIRNAPGMGLEFAIELPGLRC